MTDWEDRFSFLRKKSSKSSLKNTKKYECRKHVSNNVSMSTKTVKLR